MPNADTAHTPLMTPAITEMEVGRGLGRTSEPSRSSVRPQPRPRMSQHRSAGTQVVAEPLTDAGIVPVQAGRPEPPTSPTPALPKPRPAGEGAIAGDLPVGESPGEVSPNEPEAAAVPKPEVAKQEETTSRFRARHLLFTAVRKVKKVKGILRRH